MTMGWKKPLKNEKGSAIMFAIFIMSILIFIAFEVSYDAAVEYQNSLNSLRRVQAYYAAKSCNDFSLLRIKAYQQVARSDLRKQMPDPSMVDKIWQFPLSWPLPFDGLSESDKGAFKKAVKASSLKHSFNAQISSISGKIDINDLGSPSEALRQKTRQQIEKFIQTQLLQDSPWSRQYSNFDWATLLNHITDWVDSDTQSLNGGDERAFYLEFRNQFLPPNQAFKTLDELHMVKGMEDGIFDVLAPVITLFGGKGINVNYADKDTLMAIDPSITDIVADEIIKRRNNPELGGPFREAEEFYQFIGANEQTFNEENIPLYFDEEINFEISCIGAVGNITRTITSVVYDYQKAQTRLSDFIKKQNEDEQGGNNNNNACEGLNGDQLYECECENKDEKTPGTDEFNTCVANKRTAAQNQQNNQNNQQSQLPPGPPYIIHFEVD